MKKLLTAALALCLSASLLASCGTAKSGQKDNADTADTTEADVTTAAPLPDYAGKTPSDYDADGNFILTSTDVRAVYAYNDTGYVVFTFAGESVTKIQRVLVFEDNESAEQYVNDTCAEAVNNGEVPPTMRANGSLVIINEPYSSEESSLGFYYTKSKAQLFADFPEDQQL